MAMLMDKPVRIRAEEAQAHGFPPVEVCFDLTKAGLIAHLYVEPDRLVTMSGPPGGPCHLSIRLVRGGPKGKLPTLEELVERIDRPGNRFARQGAGKVKVGGAWQPALAWTVQETPWVDACAGVLIPLPTEGFGYFVVFSAHFDAEKGIVPGEFQERVLKTLKFGTPK
ncbi:MAG: hypothetical protein M5U26_02875 [Planctomycetota bacterium]|nr:hypothetical protein [Planctomycetota bacterium]